ncbi:MAG TPA: hypothetical protein VHE35_24980, partial [Kofleriaceae bacterium]|nr:hypothetical protein [Kofleriaceae bacterium]
MAAGGRAAILCAALAIGGPARADGPHAVARPAPVEASSIDVTADEGAAMLARLGGQRARVVAGRLVIDDVAGEGRPWVGVIERRGAELWLVTDGGALRL